MRRIIVFELNQMLCAADVLSVYEIIACHEVTAVPNLAPFVEGIFHLRDLIIPVIDLNKRFSLGDTHICDKTKLIISELGDKKAGYLVNSVKQIVLCDEKSFQPVPPAVHSEKNQYLSSILLLDDEVVNMIDFSAILNGTEWNEL